MAITVTRRHVPQWTEKVIKEVSWHKTTPEFRSTLCLCELNPARIMNVRDEWVWQDGVDVCTRSPVSEYSECSTLHSDDGHEINVTYQ